MTTRNWLAVASAEHVRIGRAEGFMQVCHGKAVPLRRLRPDDWVIYYLPTDVSGSSSAYAERLYELHVLAMAWVRRSVEEHLHNALAGGSTVLM
jgi:hypothetical protein